MADIRIKDLATTASSTASDDFLAVDGSANGTRKLNAYSPTFGGNLTVSGTGNSQINGNLGIGAAPSAWQTLYGIKAIDLTNGTVFGATNDVNLTYNSYFNSSNQWIYKDTKAAGRYTQNQGVHEFFVAASGTAGNQITWTQAMTLNLSGNLGVGYASPRSVANYRTIAFGGTSEGGLLDFVNASGDIFGVVYSASSGSLIINADPNGAFASSSVQFQTDGSEKMRLFANGNLFVGASPVDGGQKLQVAGGIAATGLVDITGPDNSGANGVGNLKVYAANRTALLTFNYQNINASGALLLSTAGTTALTLDSSQNAIFANDVRVQAATSALTWFKDSSATKAWGIGSNGWAGLSGGDGSMIFGVYTGGGWYKALELSNGTTSNATFTGSLTTSAPTGGAGAWELGVANTVSPTAPNRTITIEIGGTVYYLHAKTTND